LSFEQNGEAILVPRGYANAIPKASLQPSFPTNVEFLDPTLDRKKLVFEISATSAPIIPVNAQNLHSPRVYQPILPVYDGSPVSADRRLIRILLIMVGVGLLLAIGATMGQMSSPDPSSPPQETQQNQ
jgi:hypothetical protein